MTTQEIQEAVTEREARLADVMALYDLRPVNVPPLLVATKRDIAVALDKLERKCAA